MTPGIDRHDPAGQSRASHRHDCADRCDTSAPHDGYRLQSLPLVAWGRFSTCPSHWQVENPPHNHTFAFESVRRSVPLLVPLSRLFATAFVKVKAWLVVL